MTTPNSPPSARTRIRRTAERGCYDPAALHRIIDDAWHCHVAFSDKNGTHCIPMACWRVGDALYIHGSNGSRTMKALSGGAQVCVAITHLDGLVLARSAFNHSMNYRSAVIYGQCEEVKNEDKLAVLDQFMRRIGLGRELEARQPNRKELAATTVLRLALTEAAAKIRSGGPEDDPDDMSHPVWAGVLPLRMQALPADRDPECRIDAPEYVRNWASS